MNNSEYYIWKEDEEQENKPDLELPVAAPLAVAPKPNLQLAKEFQSDEIKFTKRMRELEQYNYNSNLFLVLTFASIFLLIGCLYSNFFAFFALPGIVAAPLTIYFYRRKSKSSRFNLSELKRLKEHCLAAPYCKEKDIALINKLIYAAELSERNVMGRKIKRT